MEKLLKYIKKHYKEGDPILLKDLKSLDISYDNLRQKLKKLTDSNYIYRMTDGIYSYGEKSSTKRVIEDRFIKRGNKIFGYYVKESLLAELGFDKKSDYEEIITNDFKAIVRDIEVLGVKVKVRHSKIKINNKNWYVLQLLDLIRDSSDYKLDQKVLETKIKAYIEEHNISQNMVDEYINLYPAITFKNYYKFNVKNYLI